MSNTEVSGVKLTPGHEYEQTWQVHGYSMFSMYIGVTFPFATFKQTLCSFVDKNWFYTFEKNIGSMYYSHPEMELAGYWGKHDFLNDQWFRQYIQRSQKSYRLAQRLYKKHTLNRIKKLDQDNLYIVVREMGLTLGEIYGYFNTCQPQCVSKIEQVLQQELEKTVPTDQVREVLLQLTRPETRTLLDEEEIAWLQISTMEREVKSLIAKHTKKYGILGTADGGSLYTVKHYEKILAERNIEADKKRLQEKLGEESMTGQRKQAVITQYNISTTAQKLAHILAVTGHERFELRLRGWMPLDYWFVATLFPYLEQKFKVTAQLLRQLTFPELLQLILTGYADTAELAERNQFFVTGMQGGEIFICSGATGRALAQALLPQVDADITAIKGQVANPGRVTGTAYVLLWDTSDIGMAMEQMPAGSILVAGQTRPQLMPAIRKAAAIVTDEGGITSHAAIVSREMGIPAVIGTKVATKVIKTGDMIEVDAVQGLITLIKK